MKQWTQRPLSFASLGLVLIMLSGCSLFPAPRAERPEGQEAFDTRPLPGSMWRSTDGGKTFEPKVTVDEERAVTKADILSLSFLVRDDPTFTLPNELRRTPDVYVGTVDDMIFKTADGADTWEPVDFPPKKVYSFIASRRSVDRMYATGVIADRGKIFRTTDGGATWLDVYSEPGTGTSIVSLAEHPRNINMLFAGTSAGTVVKSTNGGDTWKNVGTQVTGPVTVIAFDAQDANTLYLLAFNSKIYISRNAGDTFDDLEKLRQEARKANPSAAPTTVPTSFVSLLSDPNISGTLYAGTKTGMFRSRDFGVTWEKVNIIESAEQFSIRSLAVNPKNSDELIFAAGRAFYKSNDAGATWSVQQLNVDRDISVIAYDPLFPETIYIGLRKLK